MGSLIITCFLLAVSLFAMSNSQEINCDATPLCAGFTTAKDFLCPKSELGQNQKYLIMNKVNVSGNSITGFVLYDLGSNPIKLMKKKVTIDVCRPSEAQIKSHPYTVVRATVSGDRYTASLCDVHPMEDESFIKAFSRIIGRELSRIAYCTKYQARNAMGNIP